MNWRCHIEYIGSKLSTVCYMMRSIKPYTSISTIKKVYHSCFNSVIQYGLPFWCNSPQSLKIFRVQKNIIRIMMGQRRRDSCWSLFRELEILPLAVQYIFSLMLFVIKNRKEFIANTETYEIKSRQWKDFHQSLANLKKYQNVIYYLGIKVYNNLSPHIKDISDDLKKLEVKLKQILQTHSFYSLQEYLIDFPRALNIDLFVYVRWDWQTDDQICFIVMLFKYLLVFILLYCKPCLFYS
jgi:hypothetical protein